MSLVSSNKDNCQYESVFALTWELINSLESNCSGKLATISDQSFTSFAAAAKAGAVHWASHHVTSKDQLAGALVGFELAVSSTGYKTSVYFIQDVTARRGRSKFDASKILEIDLEDASENGEFTKAQLTISSQGIALVFDEHSDYVSEDNKGQPIWIERNNGEINVVVFDDINNEEPTHVISLEGARNTARREG